MGNKTPSRFLIKTRLHMPTHTHTHTHTHNYKTLCNNLEKCEKDVTHTHECKTQYGNSRKMQRCHTHKYTQNFQQQSKIC